MVGKKWRRFVSIFLNCENVPVADWANLIYYMYVFPGRNTDSIRTDALSKNSFLSSFV